MNWKFWAKPKSKPLRIRLFIGGLLMWDISENELRAMVAFGGGHIVQTSQTKFPNQIIEFVVST